MVSNSIDKAFLSLLPLFAFCFNFADFARRHFAETALAHNLISSVSGVGSASQRLRFGVAGRVALSAKTDFARFGCRNRGSLLCLAKETVPPRGFRSMVPPQADFSIPAPGAAHSS